MKQVQQNYRTGELKVADVPAPGVGRGMLLVATRVSLISSGTEKQLIDLARSSLAGKALARPDLVRRVVRNVQRDGLRPTIEKVFAKLDTPIPLGYSVAGRIIEVGRGVSGYAVGDRVACAGAAMANHAEINAVPKNLAIRIPDGVSDEDASFVTLGAIAMQGLRQAAPTLGETFVVMGLGLIGLITMQLLKANGCRVIGYDPNAERTALAATLGADLAISDNLQAAVFAFTGGIGTDGVIVTASSKSSEPVNVAAEISRLKGRVVLVGLTGLTLDREPFYKRELDLRLSMSYGPGRHDPSYEIDGHDYPLPYVRWTENRNMAAFLALISSGNVTPASLVTHRFPLANATDAYAVMQRGQLHLAMLLICSDAVAVSTSRTIERAKKALPQNAPRVAFIGFGNYARSTLLPALKRAGDVLLQTVVTTTGLSAGHAADKHGFTTVSTDPDSALADPAIDMVVIATRHDTHSALATIALQAGKHVFCEKPLAVDDDGLAWVLDAAQQSDALLCVGFNRRFAPLFVAARNALSPRTGPLVMLYRINAGAIGGESWIQRDEGGGRIIGEICHFIDAMVFLTGALPVEVSAQAARGHSDAVSILMRFSDGSTGTIVYSSLGDAAVAKEYLEVFASNCVVQLDDFRMLRVTCNGKVLVRNIAQDKGQAAMFAAFLATIRGGGPAPISLQELRAVTEATFAIEDALRTGAVVSIGSAK